MLFFFLAFKEAIKRKVPGCFLVSGSRQQKIRGLVGESDQFKISFADKNAFPTNNSVRYIALEIQAKSFMLLSWDGLEPEQT